MDGTLEDGGQEDNWRGTSAGGNGKLEERVSIPLLRNLTLYNTNFFFFFLLLLFFSPFKISFFTLITKTDSCIMNQKKKKEHMNRY